jgi:hypothetical protein
MIVFLTTRLNILLRKFTTQKCQCFINAKESNIKVFLGHAGGHEIPIASTSIDTLLNE